MSENRGVEKLLEVHMEQDHEHFKSIEKKLDVLIEAHHKQRGFIAGFSAAVSVLASTMVAMAVYIWRSISGH